MKKLLFILILFCSFQGFGQTTVAKVFWRLNGNSNDASGNGNNGTDTDISYSQAYGRLNQGAFLNGNTSSIKIFSDLNIPSNSPFTIFLNIKLTSLPALGTLDTYAVKFIADNTSPYTGSLFYIRYHNNGGTYNLRYEGQISTGLSSYFYPITLNVGVWYSLAISFDGNNVLKAYFNGVYKGSSNPANNLNLTGTTQFSIGVDHNGSHYNYGSIDEVIVDNTVWSPAKVKNYYLLTKGQFQN